MKKLILTSFICFILGSLLAQNSWKHFLDHKSGEVIIYYYDSENYIINKNGRFEGVEYQLFIEFFDFIEKKYQINIKPRFVRADSFGQLYQSILKGKNGEFGACSFSMTPERMLEVHFSPRYLPDIEVMVSSNDLPIVDDTASFLKHFSTATAYAVRNTTFEADILQIKKMIPNLKIVYLKTGLEVLQKVNDGKNCFGYAELANYITSFQNGLTIKRQSLFRTERLGHGFIYPNSSNYF